MTILNKDKWYKVDDDVFYVVWDVFSYGIISTERFLSDVFPAMRYLASTFHNEDLYVHLNQIGLHITHREEPYPEIINKHKPVFDIEHRQLWKKKHLSIDMIRLINDYYMPRNEPFFNLIDKKFLL